ncbi:MAG: ABC transporter permease [Gemmataceae bacterium]|nr:ABC transporter permease [Gemmataceae bacterium]
MIQPRLAWELARKDLALFAADRRGLLLCFAVPVVLAIVFGAVFHQPPGGEGLRPRAWIVDQDGSAFTARVIEALESSPRLRAERCERATADRKLALESSGVAILLPPGFGKAALAGKEPRVGFLHHPLGQVEARCAEGLFAEAVLRESARELLGPLAATLKRPFAAERTSVGGGALSENAYPHSFCGMTLQYLLFWGMDCGLLLLRERRQGIWRRLRAAPLSRGTLLAGKALSTALVALCQLLATFAVGALFFGVGVTGSPLGFGLMALSAALLSAAAGLLVAALGGSEGRARSVAILAILTLSLLGGLWLPSFLLPGWAQRLALGLPTTWAARGLEGVCWQGMGLAEAARCAGVLAGFSLAFLSFAWWRLVRVDGPNGGSA